MGASVSSDWYGKHAAYSAASRDTMLFNNASRVEKDPDRECRLVMEQVLKLA